LFLGFQVYDPYSQNMANVTNVQTGMPINLQYPVIYQSPTRQLPSTVQQPQAPTTPNQMVYQAQVPLQQQNEYYSKNVYKSQPYNAATYYPAYVPYVIYILFVFKFANFRRQIMSNNNTSKLRPHSAQQISFRVVNKNTFILTDRLIQST
jgi:hypothetical protein